MKLDDLKAQIPDTAKDIRLNLGNVLSIGAASIDSKNLDPRSEGIEYYH